eukprot:TRINITY_DN16811_c0_g1_i1.p1 TRINITY_DN16811_c0_g1~~TRINITY_DN16811_c0_g1_i1.p1  ORF type:complete len:450 (+),score=117.94 TRINITY_DN16811_c0_g1_i1:54-1403(+)
MGCLESKENRPRRTFAPAHTTTTEPTAMPARPCEDDQMLHVISTVFNPAKYSSRAALYENFRRHMLTFPNVRLYTVEASFDGTFEVTSPGGGQDPRDVHVQLHAPQRLWLKENLINVAAQQFLPKTWKYMAWVDGDLEFEQQDWVERTLDALHQHPVVQVWETAKFLGPEGQVLDNERSFGYFSRNGIAAQGADYNNAYPHPGFGWAVRRDAYDVLGGLPDFNITGSGDTHLAYALQHRPRESVPLDCHVYLSDGFWAALAVLHKMVRKMYAVLKVPEDGQGPGYAVGVSIRHHWHGDWRDRGYVRRYEILRMPSGALFDPLVHVEYGSNGVIRLAPTAAAMVAALEEYFRSRKEDAKNVMTDHATKHSVHKPKKTEPAPPHPSTTTRDVPEDLYPRQGSSWCVYSPCDVREDTRSFELYTPNGSASSNARGGAGCDVFSAPQSAYCTQ